jgi:hypothetical protein
MDVQTTIADKLLARRPDLAAILYSCKPVEDVLAGPETVKYCHEKTGNPYLPKNLSEHPDEYAKRLQITPCFFEAPAVLQSRQGALFRTPPRVQMADEIKDFEYSATLAGASLLDVMVKVSELVQVNGFSGILVDRETLPPDVTTRDVSVAEAAERRLGRPLWAIYDAAHILDYAEDNHGLLWVKLLDADEAPAAWDAKKTQTQTVRIVDRQNITIYKITTDEQGKRTSDTGTVTAHNWKDANQKACVPFVLFHPFPGRNGVGRSILRGVAEADLAATRTLSELTWLLHMLVPILVLKHQRGDGEDIESAIGLGSSRYIPLKAGMGQNDPGESLEFCQVDAAPADRLFSQYKELRLQAKEQASKADAVGVSGPVEQSGISKAWTFKTGEERILHLLAQELQRQFDKALDLIAIAANVDVGECSIEFPASFDVKGPDEVVDVATRVLPMLAEYGLNAAIMQVLERVCHALIDNPTQEQWDEIKEQIARLEDVDLRPAALLSVPTEQPNNQPE